MTRRNTNLRRRAALRYLAAFAMICAVPAPALAGGPEAGRPRAPARDRPDPALTPTVACSFSRPVCVHVSAKVHPAAARAALAAAERAFATLDALRLPRPRADGSLGGSDAFDV